MEFLKTDSKLGICDIGANPVDPTPFIEELYKNTPSVLYGFEPHEVAFNKLEQSESRKFFKYGIGDGEMHNLNLCKASGMSSFLKPKFDYLNYFHGFAEWAEVIGTAEVDTKKLDEVEFEENIDLFKIDVQGYESEVIAHGAETLRKALCVQLEVSPVPIYEGEKPLSYISKQLEDLGFMLHALHNVNLRCFKPVTVNQNIYDGINHVFQLDCVFIRSIEDLSKFNDEDLKKLAQIMFYCFNSFDLSYALISELDKRNGTKLTEDFRNLITQRQAAKA